VVGGKPLVSDNPAVALGLRLVDEVAHELWAPLRACKACIETLLANWELLDPSQRDELLAAALKRADELEYSLQALEARIEAVDEHALTP
jgi:K+-sensing histidine kinase KdpD